MILFWVWVSACLVGASGRPGLFSFLEDTGEEEEGLGVMEYLLQYGERLFGAPDQKSGEAVSQWGLHRPDNPEELGVYPEGDILFPSKASARNGLKASSARWPKGVVPYVFGASFNQEDMAMIERAMHEYHKVTCVRFVPRSSQKDYIVITSGNTGCWSSVGRVGGGQEVNLQSPGCLTKLGTVMHEMMHALGFLHEQNRWERDTYVVVNYNNIEQGREANFKKAKKAMTDSLGIPYDYHSVMHYSSTAFSINGRPTISPTKRGVTLGQREGLSKQDIQKIRRMYKCKKTH